MSSTGGPGFTRRTSAPAPSSAPSSDGAPASDISASGGRAQVTAMPQVFRKAPPATPHRLSIDVDDQTYIDLRIAAARRGTTVVSIVRGAISKEIA